MTYSEQKEGRRQTLPYSPDVPETPIEGLELQCSYSELTKVTDGMALAIDML
jgi:hypothetical protein